MSGIKKKSLTFVQPKSGFWLLTCLKNNGQTKQKVWLKNIMAKWYQFLITWQTIFNHSTWQPTDHVNHFCMIKLKYGMQNKWRPKFSKELLQKVYLLNWKYAYSRLHTQNEWLSTTIIFTPMRILWKMDGADLG